MDERAVVTVFLRNAGQVLLLRRSEDVGSYSGKWGGVAGHAEGDPGAAALREVEEETGIGREDLTLVRQGDPFQVTDAALDIRWTVHPFLFDVTTRSIETDWETTETAWVHPTAILTRETVPDLWTSYDRVRPTVATVEADTTHGSTYISLRALEVLRDEAAVLADEEGVGESWADIAAVGAELREARGEMAAVRNRVDEAMFEASRTETPEAVHEAAKRVIDAAVAADEAAAANAAAEVAGKRVFTLSRSGTVRQALQAGDPAEIIVPVSRPGGEGTAVAETFAGGGADVVLTSDANVPAAIERADVVLVGADTVLADGDVVNKVGTTAAMLAARHAAVDGFVVCAAAKISHERDWEQPAEEPKELYEGDADIEVLNPVFERTPAALVSGVITETGVLDREAVESRAQTVAEFQTWLD